MDKDIRRMILVLESEGVRGNPVNANQKRFTENDDLIDHIYKNFAQVDSFEVYTHYRHSYEMVHSGIIDLRQLKRITFYCDSEVDICQAKLSHSKSSKFIFCLITEVTNRIQNALDSDVLNPSLPVNTDSLASKLAERRRRVQSKQQNLTTDGFSTPLQSSLLHEAVQRQCSHRQCASCAENWTENAGKCPKCQEETTKNTPIDRGFQQDMRTLALTSSFCDWRGKLRSYQVSFDQCHEDSVCEYCDEQFNSTNALNQHMRHECPMITVSCALKEYGCSHSGFRAEMKKHYLSEEHQGALFHFVRRLELGLRREPHQNSNDRDIGQLQQICQLGNSLADRIQILEKDLSCISDKNVHLQNSLETVMKDVISLKSSAEEQNICLDRMKCMQETLKRDIESIKHNVESTHHMPDDGTLVWKIPNFLEKLADAQSERQTSIYSPPFYTSPTGYKMRMRLYLNGEGNARRTHMSLFFVLMRGEYDGILKFPFNYTVTFCLFDQTDSRRHIIDSFRPDVKLNSFQRPRSNMNIASGIPKFVPLSVLEGENNSYIQDDTMFIKGMVDFVNIPRALLPDVFGINPALPIYRQHDIILEIVDRYRRHRLIRCIQALCDTYQIDRSTVYLSPSTAE
ncbi:hypothetical protein I4U23_005352 [Adineta vaga]|nr:hypothetical protein I4U23_005352 [Adineta vaga]